mgnify:CR=1 FL=1
MDERLTPFEDKMKKSYHNLIEELGTCLLYTSPSPRDA